MRTKLSVFCVLVALAVWPVPAGAQVSTYDDFDDGIIDLNLWLHADQTGYVSTSESGGFLNLARSSSDPNNYYAGGLFGKNPIGFTDNLLAVEFSFGSLSTGYRNYLRMALTPTQITDPVSQIFGRPSQLPQETLYFQQRMDGGEGWADTWLTAQKDAEKLDETGAILVPPAGGTFRITITKTSDTQASAVLSKWSGSTWSQVGSSVDLYDGSGNHIVSNSYYPNLYISAKSGSGRVDYISVGAEAPPQVDYLATARRYADDMIADGRDTYGSVHSPMFAAALDRSSHQILTGGAPPIDGIRSFDRILTGANPMHDQMLYKALYRLSSITGDPSYAQQADSTLQYFWQNAQSPVTGLMAWGEHLGWDFQTEAAVHQSEPAVDQMHEFFRPWGLWDKTYELAPEAAKDFAQGLWDHQIYDQNTCNFSRHARYDVHAPGTGYEFPRHGGYYIHAWAEAYAHSSDPDFREEMLTVIERLTDSFTSRQVPGTNAIPAGTAPGGLNNCYWPANNIELAINAYNAAELLPAVLAQKLRDLGAAVDAVFLSTAHDPAGNGFVNRAYADTLVPGDPLGNPDIYSEVWDEGYGTYTHAGFAVRCLERYGQVGGQGYLDLILETADVYRATLPDTSVQLYPGALADVIALLLGAYDLTKDELYLARADLMGQWSLNLFFDELSGLPKATSQHEHYEAITRGDELALRLLDLYMVLHAGDADNDGDVDFADYQILEQNFGTGIAWMQGDFDGDGDVDFADYQILEVNFGNVGGVSPTPEPATILLLGLGATLLFRSLGCARGNRNRS